MNQAIGTSFEEDEKRIDRKPGNSGIEPVSLHLLGC